MGLVTTEGSKTSLTTLLRLPISWSGQGGHAVQGIYGLTMHKTKGADVAFVTRAGARTGTLKLGDRTYTVALADNTADAVFDNNHAASLKKLAVWLLVDLNDDKDYHPTQKGREVHDTSKPFRLPGRGSPPNSPRMAPR